MVLFLYFIPYFYIAMWLDITNRPALPHVLLPYTAALIILLAMRIFLGKAGRHKIALKGFLLNMVSTLLCILILQQNNLNKWHSYFGPFFPLPLIAVAIVAEMFIYAFKDTK